MSTIAVPRTHASMPRLPRGSWLLVGLIAALAAGTAFAFGTGALGRRSSSTQYQTAAVTRGSLQLTISATGPVTNPTSVPVTFKSQGKLAQVYVSAGDHVTAGQTLAELDTTDLQQQLAEAQATLDQQTANEANTRAGPKPEA